MKWDRFTPFQEKTIPIIIHTKKDVIISRKDTLEKGEKELICRADKL